MSTTKNAGSLFLAASSPRLLVSANATILLSTTTPVFKVATDGTSNITSVTVNAKLIACDGVPVFTCIGGTLSSITANSAVLLFTAMTSSYATITASLSYRGQTLTSSVVIAKVLDGTNGSNSPPQTAAQLKATLTAQITESELYGALQTRIGLVDAADTVPGSVSARISASTATAAADVRSYAYSKATTDSSIASSTNSVTARLDNMGGSGVTVEQKFTAQASTNSGLSAQYTVKVDNNGYVAGFGLASTAINGVPTSSFIINVDRFAIVAPGVAPKVMFAVGNVGGVSTIGINGTVVIDGSLVLRTAAGAAVVDSSGLKSGYEAPGTLNSAIKLGGRNFVLDSQHFVESPNNTGTGASVLMTDEATPYTRITATDVNGVSTFGNIYQWPKIVTGTQVTIGCDVRIPAAGTVAFYAGLGGAQPVAANVWTRIYMTFTYNPATRQTGHTSPSLIVDYRNYKVEIGNIGTDWTPAPEDVQSGIDTAATTSTWTGVSSRPANVAALAGTEAIQNSAIIIGGRNLYSKTTPFLDIGPPSSSLSSRSTTGFDLYGTAANTGIMRMQNVIPKNGTYTISFDLGIDLGNYPLRIDVCDGTSQTITLSQTVTHYSLTFTVANWSAATFNFIDFNDLSAQPYRFRNFIVEEGNKASSWTPSPEDVAADTAAAATTSTWVGTTGSGKPSDNATVGAPAGTYVGGTLAQTVEGNASTALGTANTANSTANTALTNANNAVTAVGDKLSKSAGGPLSGAITLSTGGALQVGTASWVSGAPSGTGVVMSPKGIAGVYAGTPTFYIDATTGEALFGGTLSAASGTLGSLHIATGGGIHGGAWTSWNSPAANAGTGFYIGPEGLVLGNYNAGRYIALYQNGDIGSPNFSVVSGVVTIVAPTITAPTITAPTISNPVLTGFSLAALPDISAAIATRVKTNIGSAVANSTGGTAPFFYQWVLQYSDKQTPNISILPSLDKTSATIYGFASVADGTTTTSICNLTITDSSGLSRVSSFKIDLSC